MQNSLEQSPLLILFLVAALGYLLGNIKVKGVSLGVAGVLFVGLAFGMINPNYQIPSIIFDLGLIFFVYSIGLSSGTAFFQSFQRNGFRDIGFVVFMLTITASIAVAIHFIFGFDKATTVGMYAGSTTNTTALAAVVDVVGPDFPDVVQSLVIGYTYSYPMGVIGIMIVLKLMEKVLKIDYEAEKMVLRKDYPVEENLSSRSIKITQDAAVGNTVRDIVKMEDFNIVFTRVSSEKGISLTNWDTAFSLDDHILIIGSKEELDRAEHFFGHESKDNLYYDRKEFDVRQIFVSNTDMVGKSLAALNLNARYNAIITRIRRGDTEILAAADTVLELGDRIRFIAKRKELRELSNLFGDSYYQSSRLNLFSFGVGMALGLLLGMVEFGFGGMSFKLGMAGGPLVVGLLLGAMRRTGPMVWSLPYSANVALRQLGLIMLLAVVGLKSGASFLESLNDQGFYIFMGGAILSMFSATLMILIGYKLFKIPFSLLLGFMSNQPAILDFSMGMSNNRVPMIGYAMMFPIALILKIFYAQILYSIL